MTMQPSDHAPDRAHHAGRFQILSLDGGGVCMGVGSMPGSARSPALVPPRGRFCAWCGQSLHDEATDYHEQCLMAKRLCVTTPGGMPV